MSRIGIFSGSFDPVHKGHMAFARSAVEKAGLDDIYFAPEIQPRRKDVVSHIARRLAMLRLATMNEPALKVLELPDKHFDVARTLPRLKKLFPNDQLYYVCGSDMIEHMPSWKLIERMLVEMGLVVGVRNDTGETKVQAMLTHLPVQPKETIVFKSPGSTISSSQIRRDISEFKKPKTIDEHVQKYIDEHWLYHAISS